MWFIVGVDNNKSLIKIMDENKNVDYISSEKLIELYNSDDVYGFIADYFFDSYDDEFGVSEYIFYIFPEYCIQVQDINEIEQFIRNNVKEVLSGFTKDIYGVSKVSLGKDKVGYKLVKNNRDCPSMMISIFRDNLGEPFNNYCTVTDYAFIDKEYNIVLQTVLESIKYKYRKYFSKFSANALFDTMVFYDNSWYLVNENSDCHCLCDIFKLFNDKSSIKIIPSRE